MTDSGLSHRDNMGYNYVESQEVPVPGSSSGRDEILSEKRNHEDGRRNTAVTSLDTLALQRTYSHHLGRLHLGDVEGNDP